MPAKLSHIVRCLDLRDQDVAAACASRESTRALLTHLAACSSPGTGVAKVLLVFARMATTASDWIDGGLIVDLIASGETTRVDTVTDLGGGLRERLLPSLTFQAPLEEFTLAVERVPHLIAPLTMRGKRGKHVTLSASATVRRTSMPPPPIEIAAESLLVLAPAPVPLRAPEPPVPIVPMPASVKPPRRSGRPATLMGSEPPLKDVDSGWDD